MNDKAETFYKSAYDAAMGKTTWDVTNADYSYVSQYDSMYVDPYWTHDFFMDLATKNSWAISNWYGAHTYYTHKLF